MGRADPQVRLNPNPRVPRFFFFFPNPAGSDVKRMWVVPPGSGLGPREFKGADHRRGYGCLLWCTLLDSPPSPDSGSSPGAPTGKMRAEIVGGGGNGKEASEYRFCLRPSAS